MKKRKIWMIGVSGITVIAPLATAISCGGGDTKDEPTSNNGGANTKSDAFATYSDKAVSLNSLMGLAYQMELTNEETTASNYDVKDTEHNNTLLVKRIDSIHKHTEQQHGQTAIDIANTFKQVNLDIIYKLVEAIYGKNVKPVYTAKVAEVGKAIEDFNKSGFKLPTVQQLKDLQASVPNTNKSAFTNISKYATQFENWTNRQVKLEIVARIGEEYKVANNEETAKALDQNLKLATWPIHKDGDVAIYDGEFIVRVVAQ